MADNISALDALFKTVYVDRIAKAGYSNFPFLDWVPKKNRVIGNGVKVPIIYGDDVAVSGTATTGYSDFGGLSSTSYTATLGKIYGSTRLTGDAISSAGSKEAAFEEVYEAKVTGLRNAMLRRLAGQVFRTGTGSVGQVGSTSGLSTTLTLENRADIFNFEKGMRIQLSATDGAAVRDSGDYVTITAVNTVAGTLTLDNALSNISGATTGDYIVLSGDLNTCITGLSGWITTSSSPGSLYGMSRTADVTRLSGVKSDGSGKQLDVALIDLCTEVSLHGGNPDAIWVNQLQYANLVKLLQDGARFVAPLNKGEVGFKGISILTPDGPVPVMQDRFCPGDRAYALQKDTWQVFFQEGDLVHVPLQKNGAVWDQVSGTDNWVMLMRSFATMVCLNPGYNGVLYNL